MIIAGNSSSTDTSSCGGTDRFAGVSATLQATLFHAPCEILGVVDLGAGRLDPTEMTCTFSFEISGVAERDGLYEYVIDGVGRWTIDLARAERGISVDMGSPLGG